MKANNPMRPGTVDPRGEAMTDTEAGRPESLGHSLASGSLGLERGVTLAGQIALTLAELHERGETHGGLEQDVVVLDARGGVWSGAMGPAGGATATSTSRRSIPPESTAIPRTEASQGARPLLESRYNEHHGQLSPEGRWLSVRVRPTPS